MKVTSFTHLFASVVFGGVLSSAFDINDGMDEDFIDRAIRAASAANMAKAHDIFHDINWTDQEWTVNETFLGEKRPNVTIKHFKDPKYNDDSIYIEDDDGVCYVGFQSTEFSADDWTQNIFDDPRNVTNSQGVTCEFHKGFAGGYFNSYRVELEKEIQKCVDNCDTNAHPDGCLVIGGHSQGGAIAAVAHFVWDHVKHQTFIFGNPGSLETPTDECDMDYDNVYRFQNAMPRSNWIAGTDLHFDKVLHMMDKDEYAGWFHKYHFGHHILISGHKPSTQAYYVGHNVDAKLYPWDHNPSPLGLTHRFEIHKGQDKGEGYFQVLRAMKNSTVFPISTKGFSSEASCSADSRNPDNFNMCESGVCKHTKSIYIWFFGRYKYDYKCE